MLSYIKTLSHPTEETEKLKQLNVFFRATLDLAKPEHRKVLNSLFNGLNSPNGSELVDSAIANTLGGP